MTNLARILGVAGLLTALVSAGPALATPITGQFFATDGSGNNFLLIDPNTGLGTPVSNLSGVLGTSPALATDPTTGIVYGGGGGGNPNVVTVNPITGVGTPLGPSGLGFAAIGALEFDAAGTLFASVNIAGSDGTGSDHLATINLVTGAATVIGPYGVCTSVPPLPVDGSGSCTIEGMEAIAFDAAGNLFGAVTARGAAGAPGLYSINLLTGTAAFLASILDGGGNPLSGGVTSLQFHTNGNLYGGSARAISAADGGFLVTINPNTGLFSFVGGVAATGGQPIASLAGAPPAMQVSVPEPGTFALLVMGLMGFWRVCRA